MNVDGSRPDTNPITPESEMGTGNPNLTLDDITFYMDKVGFDKTNPLLTPSVWEDAKQKINSQVIANENELELKNARLDELKGKLRNNEIKTHSTERLATQMVDLELGIKDLEEANIKLRNRQAGATYRRDNKLPSKSEQAKNIGRQVLSLVNTPGVDLVSAVQNELTNLAQQPDARGNLNWAKEGIAQLSEMMASGQSIVNIDNLISNVSHISSGVKSVTEVQDEINKSKQELERMRHIYSLLGFEDEIHKMENQLQRYSAPEYLSKRAENYLASSQKVLSYKQPLLAEAQDEVENLKQQRLEIEAELQASKGKTPKTFFLRRQKVHQKDINREIATKEEELRANKAALDKANELLKVRQEDISAIQRSIQENTNYIQANKV